MYEGFHDFSTAVVDLIGCIISKSGYIFNVQVL